MRISLAAGLCVAVATLMAPDLARWSANRATERAVAAAIAAVPGLHAGHISARRGAAIEIADVGLERNGWHVAVGRLELPPAGPGLSGFVAPALARPAAVVADNLTLTFGDTKVSIPHLEARGTDLTSSALAALLDPADPTLLADRLARLTAAEITAPQIMVGSSHSDDLALTDHLTIKRVSLTDVNAGRIGAIATEGMAMSVPSGGAMTVPFETGRIEIDGVDLPLALQMATGSRAEAATALQPLFRSLSIGAVAFRPETGTTVTVEAILAGALKGRPLTLPPSDIVALLDKPDSERTPADRQILADLVADAAGSAVLDHVEVRNVAVAKTDGRPGSMKLARAALDGYEVVKLGALSFEDASFSEGGTEFSLGRIVLGSYDGSALLTLLKQQLAGAADAAPAPMIPARTSLAMTDLHLVVPARSAGMGAIDPSKRVVVDVPVASIGAGVDAASGAIASRAGLELAYDASSATSDPSFRDLIQYGLGKLDLSADYGGTYDPAAKEIRLDRLTFDAQSLGQVAVAAVLGNVSPDMFHAGQGRDAAMQAAEDMVFQSFTFAFVNTGVVEKVLPPLAAAAKVSVPLFKAQMKAQAEISIAQAMGVGPASARIIAAVRSFIDTPKNILVVVKAPAGVKLASLNGDPDPKALLGALDIQVTANR